MAIICINSVGSQGDFNPFFLIAKELVKRGHEVRFATLSAYKEPIESAGIKHFTIRPDLSTKNTDLIAKVMDPKKGIEFLCEEFFHPIRNTFEDLDVACNGADLLITGSLAHAGLLVHKKRKTPWISLALQPSAFVSDYQFPVLPQMPWLRFLLPYSPGLVRLLKGYFKKQIHRKSKEWTALLEELGCSPHFNILFDGPHSPLLQIAAYSPLFSPRQRDWPAYRFHSGYIQGDPKARRISPELESFLKGGDHPVVFTLGSAAVLMGEKFFDTCIEFLRKSRIRGVLVCGDLAKNLKEKVKDLPSVFVTGPEPYADLFPRARAVVHQGGMGTTGEALRAGIPMVIAPFGQDQYDNACHIEKLGCGVWNPACSLTPLKLESLVQKVLHKDFSMTSQTIAEQLKAENGLAEIIRWSEQLL